MNILSIYTNSNYHQYPEFDRKFCLADEGILQLVQIVNR